MLVVLITDIKRALKQMPFDAYCSALTCTAGKLTPLIYSIIMFHRTIHYLITGTCPGRSQGVILTPKHQIIGKMTPSCILWDFLYFSSPRKYFKSLTLNGIEKYTLFCYVKVAMIILVNWVTNFRPLPGNGDLAVCLESHKDYWPQL